MGIKNKALRAFSLALKIFPKKITQETVKEFRDAGRDMTKHAKNDHRFKSSGTSRSGYRRTGNGERSIQFRVDKKKLRLKFWINPNRVTTSRGFNYVFGQNDGTKSGYRKGKVSPPSSRSSGSGGIQADDFMGRSWDTNEPVLTKRLKNMPGRLARKLFRR